MNKLFIIITILSSSFSFSNDFDCKDAMNTMQMNYCAELELAKAEEKMEAYFIKTQKHHSDDPQLIEAIDRAQEAWLAYLDAQCGSVYTRFRDGSISDLMEISCKESLTSKRTHEIWADYLAYMDGDEKPLLPEPQEIK